MPARERDCDREVGVKKFATTVLAQVVAIAALGAAAAYATDASAQGRGTGASAGARGATHGIRGSTSGVRTHAPGAHAHVGGVRGHTVHPGARVGVVIGAPIVASPWWYYPRPYYYGYDPYYYPPPVYLQEQPSAYIEQPAPAPQAAPAQYWYYCEDSKTYFPYVQTCATPWQRVIPYPPQG